jgi:hypothetical protein
MLILKILTSGIIIGLASEVGKKSGKLGGLILSLPLTTLMTLIWLWIETGNPEKIVSVSKETLIFVIPSFVFFIALPLLMEKGIHFYVSFTISTTLTLAAYLAFYKFRGEM